MKAKQIQVTGVTKEELRASLELAFLFSCGNMHAVYNGVSHWKLEDNENVRRMCFQHNETVGYTPFPIEMNLNDIYSIVTRFLKMDEQRKNDAYSKDGFTVVTGVDKDDFDFYVEYSLVEDYFHEGVSRSGVEETNDNPFVNDQPDGIEVIETKKNTSTSTKTTTSKSTQNDVQLPITPPAEIDMPLFTN